MTLPRPNPGHIPRGGRPCLCLASLSFGAGFVGVGDQVAQGQRIGVIRLGSQVDVVLPSRDDVRVIVEPGQRMKAGESVVAVVEPSGER